MTARRADSQTGVDERDVVACATIDVEPGQEGVGRQVSGPVPRMNLVLACMKGVHRDIRSFSKREDALAMTEQPGRLAKEDTACCPHPVLRGRVEKRPRRRVNA